MKVQVTYLEKEEWERPEMEVEGIAGLNMPHDLILFSSI